MKPGVALLLVVSFAQANFAEESKPADKTSEGPAAGSVDETGDQVVTLRATSGPLSVPFFRGSADRENSKQWSNIAYTMRGGVKADADSQNPRIVSLELLVNDVRRGSEWQQAIRKRGVPLIGYSMFLKSLKAGDVFPLPNGMLYQVVALDDASDKAAVRPVVTDEFSNAPTVSENCRILLFDHRATALGADYVPITVKDLNRRKAVENSETVPAVEQDVVEVALFRMFEGIGTKSREEMEKKLEVTVGSTIQVGGIEYTVKSITLPDPEKGIIGWVELSMPEFDEAKEAEAWKREQAEWNERWGPIRNP